MKKLLQHETCMPEFLKGLECKKCHQRTQQVRVLFPDVQREKNVVRLRYPIICQCGGRGSFKVELPVLFFGFILARVVLLETFRRRHQGEVDITPGDSRLFRDYVADFEQALVEFAEKALGLPCDDVAEAIGGPGLTDMDRVRMGMSVQEWKEFLRRLGHDGGADQREPS